ncbi:complex I subunit 1/NuoH family protein [Vulgatibacter incomptus]|uniref:NADH-quinone oxidoreductase subunit H n=1 Tax=Vulgatibacter incomptus TaxID=1391653 RepID=A0A0K1PAX3_9BACT|nr:complex I subunit 1 family protein [Vulgatibacter incomptus]AKU90688.1 NADH-ubiquinone oxidoreductase chain H [Vulgatibacter incomptus]
MRAAQISAIILGIVGLMAGAVAAFYLLAGALGVVAQAALGADAAYIGVAVANAITLLLVVVMVIASMLTLAERKWSALMQDRIGPNRARFGLPGLKNQSLAGLPHFLADGIKMLTKEDFIPKDASKLLFTLAPMLGFGSVFVLFTVVPMAPVISAAELPGIAGMASAMGVSAAFPVSLHVAPNLEIGLLFLFAFASIAVYGTSLAGWASNNRFALLGGVRGAAQMIAYEVSLGMSLVGAMMIFGTLQLEGMTAAQSAGIFGGALPAWGIFLQPMGFLLFFTASLAETKRAPFDAPEGESEIVGYFVEYSGMRFGMFMISEFVEIVVLSGVTAAIFLGGFHMPFPPSWGVDAWLAAKAGGFGLAVAQGLTFLLKVVALCWVQLTIRWTMTRFRYDQIQTLGWKILLPLALGNIVVTAVLLLLDQSLDTLAIVGIAELVLLIGLTALYPVKRPTSVRFSGQGAAAPVVSGHGH